MKNFVFVIIAIVTTIIASAFFSPPGGISRGPYVATTANSVRPLNPFNRPFNINSNGILLLKIDNDCQSNSVKAIRAKINNSNINSNQITFKKSANEIEISISDLNNIKSDSKLLLTIELNTNSTNPIVVLPYDKKALSKINESTDNKKNMKNFENNKAIFINPCDIATYNEEFVLKNTWNNSSKNKLDKKKEN